MTPPYWQDEQVTLHLGDCIEVLAALDENSVDAVVTDPPYGLEFMGKDWDAPWHGDDINADAAFTAVEMADGGKRLPRPTFTGSTNPKCLNCKGTRRGRTDGTALRKVCTCDTPRFPNVRAAEMRAFQDWCEQWATECMRVLKPGGHLLAFGGTRTYHRLACAIEDAGFEIRDSMHWVFGSGFPKSLNVSKAIDKQLGAQRPVLEKIPDRWAGKGDVFQRATQNERAEAHVTASATAAAAAAEGWGTALKPAHEPIVVARKPLAGTVAQNFMQYGTGALNIDACRVAASARPLRSADLAGPSVGVYGDGLHGSRAIGTTDTGRWPANILLTHSADCVLLGSKTVRSDGHHLAARGPGGLSTTGHAGQAGLDERADRTESVEAWDCGADCPVAELDRQSGVLTSGANPGRRGSDKFRDAYGEFAGQQDCTPARGADSGGASRFFPVFRYEAKADAAERPRGDDGTAHPTVKPVDLMAWLVRLVTPPGGLVLDPFAGSGTTAEACIVEGFRCVLIERDPAYAELIRKRLSKPIQPAMFGGVA